MAPCSTGAATGGQYCCCPAGGGRTTAATHGLVVAVNYTQEISPLTLNVIRSVQMEESNNVHRHSIPD
ncbi:MAG: hypothetical protein ACI944_002766 [Natronomonas sp.]|jgi:hypothetical protein